MKLVEGMDYVARQLKSVSLHFVAMESIVDVKGIYCIYIYIYYNDVI